MLPFKAWSSRLTSLLGLCQMFSTGSMRRGRTGHPDASGLTRFATRFMNLLSIRRFAPRRIHSKVVVARLCRSFCSAKAKCLQAHAHMQVREGDKLKVIRFPRSSTVVATPTSTSVTSADVNTVFSGFAVHLHSRSLPVKTTSTERAADASRNRVSEQAAGIKCGVLAWHCVTNHFLVVREGDITQSPAKSLVLRKLQLRQSCRWNVTVFAENVSDSITQVRCKVRLTLGSQEIDPDHVSVMSVKATNLKSYGFLVLCNCFNSNSSRNEEGH